MDSKRAFFLKGCLRVVKRAALGPHLRHASGVRILVLACKPWSGSCKVAYSGVSITNSSARVRHDRAHGSALLQPPAFDLIRVGSRRWFLQTGLTGLAGLSLPDLLHCRAQGLARAAGSRKAVILIWLSGGPSQLDTWDPKPDAPSDIRGPFASIATRVPGVRVCEHLPRQASILDRLALIRSVDCRSSTDHYPAPMQAGNPLAQRAAVGVSFANQPSLGSVAARFRGPNDPALPAFVGLADPPLWLADVLGAGPLGGTYEPVRGEQMANRLT